MRNLLARALAPTVSPSATALEPLATGVDTDTPSWLDACPADPWAPWSVPWSPEGAMARRAARTMSLDEELSITGQFGCRG